MRIGLVTDIHNHAAELARARSWVEDGHSFLLVGKRRVGKTSFCKKLIHVVVGSANNQVLPVYCNLQSYGDLNTETFLEHTLLALLGEVSRQVFRCKYTDLLQPDPEAGNVLLRGATVLPVTGEARRETYRAARDAFAPMRCISHLTRPSSSPTS